ncbi:MAG: HlyD family type I secretion periplasmic adaptor subunit [Desulfovibrio desulfuricans]|nr:HlyD family type I secretion periplasmic adaptor subunit [Desulfovibrio desulfuricans]
MQLTPQDKDKAKGPIAPAASPAESAVPDGARGQESGGPAASGAVSPDSSSRTAPQPDFNAAFCGTAENGFLCYLPSGQAPFGAPKPVHKDDALPAMPGAGSEGAAPIVMPVSGEHDGHWTDDQVDGIGFLPLGHGEESGHDMPHPVGPEGSVPAPVEQSGPKAFLRDLLMGGEHEQRPDKSLRQSIAETLNRLKGGEGAPPPGQQQGNPGLFAAMDAPLNGLTPDDIQFASEVDAALARRPHFGVRALSICVAVMFLCLIIWAAFASVDEVTHAEGTVVGSQRTQTIQNLEGGILRAVMVREGQIVDKGTILAQLDNEMAESAYRDAVNKAMENSLAIARLEAEIKSEPPVFPEHLEAWASQLIGRRVDESVLARARQIMQDQENAYQVRRVQLNAEVEVLQSQYTQRMHDVEEQTARKVQLDRSLALAIEQRDTAYALVQRNNFSKMEYLGLQQRVVELQGQIDALAAAIPKAQAAAEESRQRIASRRAEQASAITEEINKRRQELNSLRESISAGRDRVTRTELRAPVRGTVKQIYISTVGGVVKPGEPIMDIVPLDDTLLVEAKVKPQDVAFLRPGQDVMVKVSAYDFSIYGGLEGKLESISADTIEDKKGEHFYLVKVRTQKNAIVYHKEYLPIIPGMIVTTDILIGKKTVLDYLLKPILKAKQNALRER